MERDLVEATDQDPRFGGLVQPFQDGPGSSAGGLDPPMDLRATGSGRGTQEDSKQDEGLVEAQAHGQGSHGELLLLGLGELDGVKEPVPELGVLAAEVLILLEEWLPGGSAAVAGLDGSQDLLGMIVVGLTATAGSLGLSGDGAVG